MSDVDLHEILARAKEEMPDVADETWARFETMLRRDYGTRRVYVARHPKRSRLEDLAALEHVVDAQKLARVMGIPAEQASVVAQDLLDTSTVARLMGVTPQHVRRLRRMKN